MVWVEGLRREPFPERGKEEAEGKREEIEGQLLMA